MSQNNIKVAMLVYNMYPFSMGGAERQSLLLSQCLKENGVDVFIVTEGAKNLCHTELIEGIKVYRCYSYLNRIYKIGIKIIRIVKKKPILKTSDQSYSKLPFNPNDFDINVSYGYLKLIVHTIFLINALKILWKKRNEFDIIHVHVIPWTSFIGALIGSILNKKVLVKDSTMTGINKILEYPFGSFMRRFIIKHCFFIAMSKMIEDNFKKAGIDQSKIHKVPNGVVLPEYNISAQKKEKHSCLFVGNLYQAAAKGLDILFKAWSEVINEVPDAKLYIAGDGDIITFKKYLTTIGLSNNIILLGKVNNINELYRGKEIFLLPSRREGMSNALLEAMANSMAVIATDVSGSEDLIKGNKNGILIKKNDKNELATAIIGLLKYSNLQEFYGKNARKTISQTCNIQVIAHKYISVYEKLLQYDK